MASEMGCKSVLLLWIIIGTSMVDASVDLTGKWIDNFGWEIDCSWKTNINDALQSVSLYRNAIQYAVFRPQTNQLKFEHKAKTDEFIITVDCQIVNLQGQRGHCLTKMELLTSLTDKEDIYSCDVSGERPTFKEEKKEYIAFVEPSPAQMLKSVKNVNATSVMNTFNCSSEAYPAPTLVWTVGGVTVPENFSQKSWDFATKKWRRWSVLQQEKGEAICTPELTIGTQRVLGMAAKSDAARHGLNIIAAVLVLLMLLK